MTIQKLHERAVSKTRTAGVLGVTERDVRFHLKRQAEGAQDSRSREKHVAAGYRETIEPYLKKQPKDKDLNLPLLQKEKIGRIQPFNFLPFPSVW